MRTHSKHIYTNLDIHSKHELVALFDAIPPHRLASYRLIIQKLGRRLKD